MQRDMALQYKYSGHLLWGHPRIHTCVIMQLPRATINTNRDLSSIHCLPADLCNQQMEIKTSRRDRDTKRWEVRRWRQTSSHRWIPPVSLGPTRLGRRPVKASNGVEAGITLGGFHWARRSHFNSSPLSSTPAPSRRMVLLSQLTKPFTADLSDVSGQQDTFEYTRLETNISLIVPRKNALHKMYFCHHFAFYNIILLKNNPIKMGYSANCLRSTFNGIRTLIHHWPN